MHSNRSFRRAFCTLQLLPRMTEPASRIRGQVATANRRIPKLLSTSAFLLPRAPLAVANSLKGSVGTRSNSTPLGSLAAALHVRPVTLPFIFLLSVLPHGYISSDPRLFFGSGLGGAPGSTYLLHQFLQATDKILQVLESETLIASLPRMRLEGHRRLVCAPRRQLYAPSIPSRDQTAPELRFISRDTYHTAISYGYHFMDTAR